MKDIIYIKKINKNKIEIRHEGSDKGIIAKRKGGDDNATRQVFCSDKNAYIISPDNINKREFSEVEYTKLDLPEENIFKKLFKLC